jgi:hypothetical protein
MAKEWDGMEYSAATAAREAVPPSTYYVISSNRFSEEFRPDFRLRALRIAWVR